MTARLTVISSHRPRTLSKTARRGSHGGILRESGGVLVEGHARIASVDSLGDLANILLELGPAQALTFGIPRNGDRKILSRAALSRQGAETGMTTRTLDRFVWPDGPGVLMLDHDSGDTPISREELIAIIRGAAPGLKDAAMLWWSSASSHMADARDNQDLTGLRGQRLYLMVTEAADIPRAGSVLVDRLWAAGQGRIAVSVAGAALERCPVDSSVWQPERLDFAAGAVCLDGLEQNRGVPLVIPGDCEFVETRTALPDDPVTAKAAALARKQARARATDEIQLALEAFLDSKTAAMLSSEEHADDDKRAAARATVRHAVERNTLTADFPIEVETGPSQFEMVTVEQILEDRVAFHGHRTRDPLEPGCDGGRPVGKLFLLGSRPTLFSFAHQGRSFRLLRAPQRIEVPKGRVAAATGAALNILRDDPAVFDFGGQVALVEGEAMIPLDEHSLGYHLAGGIQFWQYRKAGGELLEADIDPPAKLVRQILSLGPRRRLKPLCGIVTTPTIRPDGTVLSAPGYDPHTQLLVYLQEEVDVPLAPSDSEVRQALSELMFPFEGFPLVDQTARGALLAALLTAIVRPSLDTAPAFAMDAPVQGSGKTLLASCVAALATGHVPDVWPHTDGRDDEEVRKRLFAALREGTTALIWDNITGVFDSAALASALTAPAMRDRVLGRSESLRTPNRALLLLTGNNICPAGDLPRRIIPIRIDPGTDAPFARKFDLDPLDYVLDRRQELARAALVLIRGWLSSGSARADGRTASFEAWDDLVRQTVVWTDTQIAPGQFGDPMDLIRSAQASDPEHESLFALLEALAENFVNRWFTARDVMQRASQAGASRFPGGNTERLTNAVADIAGERALTSTKSVGRVLQFRQGRIVFGRRLVSRPGRSGREYKVETVEETGRRGFGGFGGFESGHSNTCTTVAPVDHGEVDLNPPNQPNPQTALPGASEER